MVTIELLGADLVEEYEKFLLHCPESVFYHTLKWRDVIRELIKGEECYFIARKGNEIVGALPSFLKQNNQYGNIINSLPFYGCHGAVLVKDPNKDDMIRKKLLDAFDSFAQEKRCLLATIITSPFDRNYTFYQRVWQPAYVDERVAQITELPINPCSIKDALYNLIDRNRRDAIRKAMKSNVSLKSNIEPISVEPIYQIHKENLSALKGIAKPKEFFQRVIDLMQPGKDFRLYYAEKGGEIIAGLLVFYYKDMVEYAVPTVKLKYRNLQPNSFLIFESMVEAIQEGYKYFNFGGTWKSQDSLYQFKKRWGAKDYPYYYYIKSYGDVSHIKKLSKEIILREYPWFYVLPFSELSD